MRYLKDVCYMYRYYFSCCVLRRSRIAVIIKKTNFVFNYRRNIKGAIHEKCLFSCHVLQRSRIAAQIKKSRNMKDNAGDAIRRFYRRYS